MDLEVAAEDAPPTPALGSLYDDALRAALAAALRREGVGALDAADKAHLNALGRHCATEFRALALEVRKRGPRSSMFGRDAKDFCHRARLKDAPEPLHSVHRI